MRSGRCGTRGSNPGVCTRPPPPRPPSPLTSLLSSQLVPGGPPAAPGLTPSSVAGAPWSRLGDAPGASRSPGLRAGIEGGAAGPASRDQPCSCVDATRTPPGVRVGPGGGAKLPPIEGPPRTFEPSGWPTFSPVILPGHPPRPEPPPLAPALPPAIHGPSVCLPSCWSDARP